MTYSRGVEQLLEIAVLRSPPKPPLTRRANAVLAIRPVEEVGARIAQFFDGLEILGRQFRHHRQQRSSIVRSLPVICQSGNAVRLIGVFLLRQTTFRVLGLLGLREAYRNGLLAILDLGASLGAGMKLSALELAHDLAHPSLLLGLGPHGSERHLATF
jgi:hypothetical protein